MARAMNCPEAAAAAGVGGGAGSNRCGRSRGTAVAAAAGWATPAAAAWGTGATGAAAAAAWDPPVAAAAGHSWRTGLKGMRLPDRSLSFPTLWGEKRKSLRARESRLFSRLLTLEQLH